MTDLHTITWAAISLPVSVLQPALAPTKTAQGETGTLCTDPELEWPKAEPTGWVAFSKGQALIPDPTGTPSTFNPHPGWAMFLGQPVFGMLSDGTPVAVLELTCAPTDAIPPYAEAGDRDGRRYAVGGGHVLHVCCDLTIAADNAVFGQTGPKVGSFDGGYGSWLLAATVGLKKAREIWYLCRHTTRTRPSMGLVNTVVPLADLEKETVSWAREMLAKSPLALRMLKGSLNAFTDGTAGMQHSPGRDPALLHERGGAGRPGRLRQERTPDFARFPRRP